MTFPAIYLLHGRGGSPNGSVMQLEAELRGRGLKQNYFRPLMPHSDETVTPWTSLLHLRSLALPNGALIVGVSLGGLVAAKLQELERSDLHVICISSPTHVGETELNTRMKHRVALYSSADSVIAGRTDRWPQLAEAHDLLWLDHDTDKHKRALAQILCGYLERLDVTRELEEIQSLEEAQRNP